MQIKQKLFTRRYKKTLKNSAIAFAFTNQTVENLRELAAHWVLELKTREAAYKFLQNTMDIIPISKGFKLKWQREYYKSFLQSKQECVEKLDQINNQLTELVNPAS